MKYELASRSVGLLWTLCFSALVTSVQASVIALPAGESVTLDFELVGEGATSFDSVRVEIDFSRPSAFSFTTYEDIAKGGESAEAHALFGTRATRSTATLNLDDVGFLDGVFSIVVKNDGSGRINILDYKATGFETALNSPPLTEPSVPASARIPVPATLSLVGFGLVALVLRRRKRRQM